MGIKELTASRATGALPKSIKGETATRSLERREKKLLARTRSRTQSTSETWRRQQDWLLLESQQLRVGKVILLLDRPDQMTQIQTPLQLPGPRRSSSSQLAVIPGKKTPKCAHASPWCRKSERTMRKLRMFKRGREGGRE